MNPLTSSMATLAVSAIFCLWKAYCQTHEQRTRMLRERVAYMLWVAADRAA